MNRVENSICADLKLGHLVCCSCTAKGVDDNVWGFCVLTTGSATETWLPRGATRNDYQSSGCTCSADLLTVVRACFQL